MKRKTVQQFIAESKQYLAEASPEQKARFLHLLERAQRELEPHVAEIPSDPDFLEEK